MKKLVGIIGCLCLFGNVAVQAKLTPEQCVELKKKLDKAEEALLPMSDRLKKLMQDAKDDKLDAKGKNDLGSTKAIYDKKFDPYLKDANSYYDDCTPGAK